jgi:hypothetical protein
MPTLYCEGFADRQTTVFFHLMAVWLPRFLGNRRSLAHDDIIANNRRACKHQDHQCMRQYTDTGAEAKKEAKKVP